MRGVCKDTEKMIPQSLFQDRKSSVEHKNAGVVLYPYAGQTDIYPAFYNESPDPLPNYKVSGFPLSVQFNPAIYQNVKLKSFKLYDENGIEIKKTKILQHKNDPNHLFTKLEFALMPLARLEFSHKYTAVFEGKADGVKVTKQWSFTTTRPKEKLYRVSENITTLQVKAGTTILLYMVPSHRRDLLKNYRIKGRASAVFIDQNTLKVTLPKQKSSGSVSIQFANKKKVSFTVE